MTSLFFELGRSALAWLLVIYTMVAISHYVVQLVFAHRTYRRQRSPAFASAHPGIDVAVDIVVPVYNEEPELLEACLASALAQDHRGAVQVVVVDDGSPNRASLDAIYDRFEDLGVRVVRSPRNVGKRHAQALALPLCTGEIIVTLDSDSVLAPDAVRMLTRQFDDPRVGAATGFVDVANHRVNLLTRIQRIRYWMAFNQERAAQTWFRTVMCCSGPLAAYRRELFDQVRDAYLSQTYAGVACTYGDDRHLTNLVLGLGFDTVYDKSAVAWTNVPVRLGGFLRQQLRWNKSFYRELIWTVPYIGGRPWFSRFDVACQVAMPIMLTVTASSALILGLATNPMYLVRYLSLIALAALVRSTYAVLRERDLRFYLFVLYGYVSAFLLVSVRFRALGTLADARWGTRGPATLVRAGASSAAAFMATLQPLVSAVQTAGWPEAPRPRTWAGGTARLDGAWRAGNRLRAMAHPMSDDDRRRMMPVPPVASVETPFVPSCAHAAREGARFCRACGRVYVSAPVDATSALPVIVAPDRPAPVILTLSRATPASVVRDEAVTEVMARTAELRPPDPTLFAEVEAPARPRSSKKRPTSGATTATRRRPAPPKTSAAKASAPKASAPKASGPKASAPKASAPKASAPKASAIKASATKASAPRASASNDTAAKPSPAKAKPAKAKLAKSAKPTAKTATATKATRASRPAAERAPTTSSQRPKSAAKSEKALSKARSRSTEKARSTRAPASRARGASSRST
jgi:cellulose synthase/poly-beta-1,6-N-acetylglucosamine synthase-like glycosyltransferase